MKISDEKFIDAMHESVKGNEEFVYVPEGPSYGCAYFDTYGNPSCLIGHALSKCGAPAFHYSDDNNFTTASKLLPEFGLSHDVIDAALIAQVAQDSLATWGEARNKFDKYLVKQGYFDRK